MTKASLHTPGQLPETLERKEIKLVSGAEKHVSRPIIVIGKQRFRTAQSHGLSHLELPWLDNGLHYLSRWPSVFATLEAHAETDAAAAVVSGLSRKLKSDVALYQRRAKMRRVLWLEGWEADPFVHCHLIAPMPDAEARDRLIQLLQNSSIYGPNLVVKPVTHWNKLRNYLAWESTPQAWAKGGRSFPRLKGSHPLGAGGGDRVRVSPALGEALVNTGKVPPRIRTYMKAQKPRRKPQEKPVQPVQLGLPLAAPVVSFLHLVEVTRKELGLTQREAAQKLGIKQPAYSNGIVRGHDKLGPWVMNRAREFVAHRLAA